MGTATERAVTRVLLVDDDSDEHVLTRDLLDRTGDPAYELISATTCTDGLRAVRADAIDVALVDYRLGAATGPELIREIVADGSDVPCILLTGVGDKAADEEALRAGAVDYLDKATITPPELHRALRYALAHRRALCAVREREADQALLAATLGESRDRMDFALAAAGIGIWDLELDAGKVTWTDSMERVSGLSRAAFPHTWSRFLALVHPDDRAAFGALVDGVSRGDSANEGRFRFQNGADVRWHATRVQMDRRRRRRRLIGVSLDITDRKQLEEQFVQSQRMEAVGRVAGGVAHDFNNLLTVIEGYSDLALTRADDRQAVTSDLREIKAAVESAANLTRQLLAFSRKQVLEPRVVDLNAFVQRTMSLLARLIGADIRLIPRLAASLSAIKADPSQLEQVIMNLALNARDSMVEGGVLTIETANVDIDGADVASESKLAPGRYVVLSVSDTGAGMDDATKDRIFEPFFTTKEQGKGTGLGLATVYGIVKQSGGTIWVYSEVNVGTTIKVYLPAHGVPASAPARAASGSETGGGLCGTETVLVTEDQEGVRQFAVEVLSRHGYHVLAASNVREATHLLEAHEGPVHLLLTDVVMDGGSGPQLAASVTRGRPEMRVLFMSGYTDEAIGRHGMLAPGVPLLEKPFTMKLLLQKVREVIDARGLQLH